MQTGAWHWQVRLLVGWADEQDDLGTCRPGITVIREVGRKLGPEITDVLAVYGRKFEGGMRCQTDA